MTKFFRILSEIRSNTKEEILPDGTIKIVFDDGYGYKKNGDYHRLDGPAWEDSRSVRYYVNGKLHRLDGPAIIWKEPPSDRSEQYFVNGKSFSKEEYYKHFGGE